MFKKPETFLTFQWDCMAQLDIEKSLKQSFSWLSKGSLLYIAAIIAIGVIGSILSILMISGFLDSILSMLQNPSLIMQPQVLVGEILGFFANFLILSLILGIVSFFVTVWVMAFALKKLGSKTASFGIVKCLKVIVALVIILAGVAISALVMLLFFIVSPILGLILTLPYLLALFYFLIRLCLYEPAIVDRDLGIIEALKESYQISRSNVLRIFATQLIVVVIAMIAFVIASAILGAALSPAVNHAFGNDIGAKLAQVEPLIGLLASSSPELSAYTPEFIKTTVLRFYSDSLANSIANFIMILTVAFLTSSIYLQLAQGWKSTEGKSPAPEERTLERRAVPKRKVLKKRKGR